LHSWINISWFSKGYPPFLDRLQAFTFVSHNAWNIQNEGSILIRLGKSLRTKAAIVFCFVTLYFCALNLPDNLGQYYHLLDVFKKMYTIFYLAFSVVFRMIALNNLHQHTNRNKSSFLRFLFPNQPLFFFWLSYKYSSILSAMCLGYISSIKL
jgi:hypothetical protein